MSQEIEKEIRAGFNREFQGTQDSRSELHANFSKQGIKLIEYRKELIKTVAIISAGLIATPKFLDVTPNSSLYLIGLCILVSTILFALLSSRENIDIDEAQTAYTRSVLLPILDRRIEKQKEYLSKVSLGPKEAEEYRKYREAEDSSDEMMEMKKQNETELQNLHVKKLDYPSALIMFLFTSGTFFIAMSILFPSIHSAVIVCTEIIFLFVTMTNAATKLVGLYAKLVILLKKKIPC